MRTHVAARKRISLSGMDNASCPSPGAPNELQYFILTPVYTRRLAILAAELIAFNSLLDYSRNLHDCPTHAVPLSFLSPAVLGIVPFS